MNSRTSRRIKRISRQQEKRAAADLGGRTQAASGASRLGGGGDVRVVGEIRVECKMTESDRYILKKTELEKLKTQAAKTLETPVFQFAFRDKLGKLEKYAVLPGFEHNPHASWPYELDTPYNSVILAQDYLRNVFSSLSRRLRITFRDGNPWVKQWEVMPWERYLAKQGEADDRR